MHMDPHETTKAILRKEGGLKRRRVFLPGQKESSLLSGLGNPHSQMALSATAGPQQIGLIPKEAH